MLPKHTLGKEKRLKSRKLIEGLFKKGRSVSAPPIRAIFQFQAAPAAPLQAGFAAPSKNFKKAVDRNRVKRLMKEAYRKQYHPLEEALQAADRRLSVFFIYSARELPEQELITSKISLLLQQLIKKSHESGPSHT